MTARMSADEKIIISGEAVIHPDDLKEDFIRSSGPGGQNVNKVATAVQLRFRTQEQNRADARARLTALVAKAAEPPPPPRKKTRPSKGAVERRLKSKAGRSTVKKLRGRVDGE